MHPVVPLHQRRVPLAPSRRSSRYSHLGLGCWGCLRWHANLRVCRSLWEGVRSSRCSLPTLASARWWCPSSATLPRRRLTLSPVTPAYRWPRCTAAARATSKGDLDRRKLLLSESVGWWMRFTNVDPFLCSVSTLGMLYAMRRCNASLSVVVSWKVGRWDGMWGR